MDRIKIYTSSNLDLSNCPKLKKTKFDVVGQGLYNSFNIRLIGTGYNYYIINCYDGDVEYEFHTEDIYIDTWIISSKYECCEDVEDDFRFDASGQYYNTSTQEISKGQLLSIDNPEYIKFCGKNYKISKVDVFIDKKYISKEPLNIINGNCYTIVDYEHKNSESILDKFNKFPESSKLIKSTLKEFLSCDQDFYFKSLDGNPLYIINNMSCILDEDSEASGDIMVTCYYYRLICSCNILECDEFVSLSFNSKNNFENIDNIEHGFIYKIEM